VIEVGCENAELLDRKLGRHVDCDCDLRRIHPV
jgi:hypothetical protein